MRSTDSGIFFTSAISLMTMLLLSDCLDILRTMLVISIPSEKVIRTFLLSRTLTDLRLSSVVVSLSTACTEKVNQAMNKKRGIREKIRSIT